MTFLLATFSFSAIILGWLYVTERQLRAAAEYETDLIHRDYRALQDAHEVALEDLDAMVEAMAHSAKIKHPAGRLTLVRGEGA
jgi:hypothetical protein